MADEHDKHPTKIVFTRSAQTEQTITNQDGSPLRNKDNAEPTLKPSFSRRPAPNMAPGGTIGIRTGLGMQTPAPEPVEDIRFLPEYEECDLAHDHGIEVDTKLFTEGRVLSMPGYSFEAKVYDEPSKYGIDGGKISKLDLRKDGVLVARYDRGWDLEPITAEAKEALHRVRTGLDDTPAKRITAPEHDPGKGRDVDR